MKKRIAVFVSGGGSNLQCLIDSVNAGEIEGEIVLVLSDKEDAYGLVRARDHQIPAVYINKKQFSNNSAYNYELLNILKDYKVDLIVLAGYLSIVPQEIIRVYQNSIINIHPSLIPSFCGRGFYGEKVHRAVLEYGVKITGATVHFVDGGTDTGPIIDQTPVFVGDLDKVEDIQKRVLEAEHKLLKKAVAHICTDKILIRGRRIMIKEVKDCD